MEPLVGSEEQHEGGEKTPSFHDGDTEGLVPEATNLETPSSPLQSVKGYCNSYQISELFFCMAVGVSGILFEFIGIEPRERAIPYQKLSTGEFALNQVYDHEFVSETISDSELVLYGIAFPCLLQLLLSYFSQRSRCHNTICVYLAAIGITLLATGSVKAYVGYLRPIFYDQCIPDDEYTTCTGDEVEDARQSFPSGHASISFCGLGLLSFFLENLFGASKFRNVGPNVMPTEKSLALARILSVMSKTPLLLAGYISASRIVDNKHHPADVVGGAALGLSVALWIHNIWYEYSCVQPVT